MSAPAPSHSLANSAAIYLPFSSPMRNLTETVLPLFLQAETIFSARGKSASSALPSPFLYTLGTGQPMLMSTAAKGARYSLSQAARRMSASPPNSCAAVCFSEGSRRSRARVASLS